MTLNPTVHPIVQQRVIDDPTASPSLVDARPTSSSGGLSTEMWIIVVLGAIIVVGVCVVLIWCKFWRAKVVVAGMDSNGDGDGVGNGQAQIQLGTSSNTTADTVHLKTEENMNLPHVALGEPNNDDDSDGNEALYDNGPGFSFQQKTAGVSGHDDDDSSSGEELFQAGNGNTQA